MDTDKMLIEQDIVWVLRRLPYVVFNLMKKEGSDLMVEAVRGCGGMSAPSHSPVDSAWVLPTLVM